MKKDLMTIRESMGISQQDMAKKLSVGKSTYCQYENGKRSIPYNVVKKISKILNIDEEDIFLPIKFTISK